MDKPIENMGELARAMLTGFQEGVFLAPESDQKIIRTYEDQLCDLLRTDPRRVGAAMIMVALKELSRSRKP